MHEHLTPVARSLEPITDADLVSLAKIANAVFDELFAKTYAKSQIYTDRLLLIALCQGGALHFLNGTNGVKDLDVWAFFRSHPERPFPARAHWVRDFGPSHLGRHPNSSDMQGRAVDIFGRSIEVLKDEDGVSAVRRWLSQPQSTSPWKLAQKAVIGIYPPRLRGEQIWPFERIS